MFGKKNANNSDFKLKRKADGTFALKNVQSAEKLETLKKAAKVIFKNKNLDVDNESEGSLIRLNLQKKFFKSPPAGAAAASQGFL